MLQWLPAWLVSWLGAGRAGLATTVPPPAAPATVPCELRDWNATTAVELIARLMELTESVSEEVQTHSGNIESINAELSGVKQGDTSAVAAVVCKLLVKNGETQRRLEQAELKLQAQQRQLHDVSTAARMDGLTGLINRRALDESLARCLADFERKGRPASLLLLDVDHFKLFNDTHGHVAGDEALKHVADVLRSQCRETDIVARFGGEEFVVIFTGAALNAVSQRSEKMRLSVLAKPVSIEGLGLHVSASGGLAEIRPGDDVQAWLKRADAALYAAKSDNRNCLYWHDGNQPLRFQFATDDAGRFEQERKNADRRRLSADLSAESFSDPTFVSAVARRIAEWRRGGATFSVILARLDRLEGVIRQHGQEAHQAALGALNQMARVTLRDMDQPSRWTNDGLAILLPSARASDAANVSRRLLEAVERCELPVSGGTLRLTLSIGAAELVDGNDSQRLLERAWLALDAARQAGGGQVHLHDGLQTIAAPTHHLAAV